MADQLAIETYAIFNADCFQVQPISSKTYSRDVSVP